MYYYLLDPLIQWPSPGQKRTYRVYLDVKDTRSRLRVKLLRKVLQGRKRDEKGVLISRVQNIPAEELQLMQLTDFLLGAPTFRNRKLSNPSWAKEACVERIENRLITSFHLDGSHQRDKMHKKWLRREK